MTAPPPVITVNATIMHGALVCWHRSVAAAETHHPVLVASRAGVEVRGEYLTSIPADWVEGAKQAHLELAADADADMGSWATHCRRTVLGAASGPLEPKKGA